MLHSTNLPSKAIWPDHFALYYLLNSAYSCAWSNETSSHYNHFETIFTSPFWREHESTERQQLKHAIFIDFLYQSDHKILPLILPYITSTDFFQILHKVDDAGEMIPRPVHNILEAQLLDEDDLPHLPEKVTVILNNEHCTTQLLLSPGTNGYPFLSQLVIQLKDKSKIEHRTVLEQTIQIIISSQHCTSDVIEKALEDAEISFDEMVHHNDAWTNIILSSKKCPKSWLFNNGSQNNANLEQLNALNTSKPILDTEPSKTLDYCSINHITMHVLNGFLIAVGITAIALAFTILAHPVMCTAGIAVACIGGVGLMLGGYGLFKTIPSMDGFTANQQFRRNELKNG